MERKKKMNSDHEHYIFFVDNKKEREAISSRTVSYLQELYPCSENDKEEIEGAPFYANPEGCIPEKSPLQEKLSNNLLNYVLKNTSLPGKGNLSGKVSRLESKTSIENNYILRTATKKWNGTFYQNFSFQAHPSIQEPIANDYLSEINKKLNERGYNSKLDEENSFLEINGYKSNKLRKEKMDQIFLRGKDKIPLMREFLVENFPKSNYGEGEKNDLQKKWPSAIVSFFKKKYSYVKRELEKGKE